jgi:hypothetical protein
VSTAARLADVIGDCKQLVLCPVAQLLASVGIVVFDIHRFYFFSSLRIHGFLLNRRRVDGQEFGEVQLMREMHESVNLVAIVLVVSEALEVNNENVRKSP